jgi:hypothetical protein
MDFHPRMAFAAAEARTRAGGGREQLSSEYGKSSIRATPWVLSKFRAFSMLLPAEQSARFDRIWL